MSDPSNPHKLYTKYLHYAQDPPPSVPRQGDSVYINKKIGNWDVRLDADEYGKVTCIARRTIGKLGGTVGDESNINITLQTTTKRIPGLKAIGYYPYEPKFVEIDDKLDRTSKEFKDDYTRTFAASSILSTSEFFNEIIGADFEALIQDKTFAGYLAKFTEKTSLVERPHNKNYVKM